MAVWYGSSNVIESVLRFLKALSSYKKRLAISGKDQKPRCKNGNLSWKFTSKNPIDIVSSQSTQATCFPCGETSPRRHDERSRPSDGPHPAGQKGCIDVTEVDCARSVIYTNKTKLHRNQHANFSGWWFQRFFMFTPIWGRFPIWLIFFKGVETTNQFSTWSFLQIHITTRIRAGTRRRPWVAGCFKHPRQKLPVAIGFGKTLPRSSKRRVVRVGKLHRCPSTMPGQKTGWHN